MYVRRLMELVFLLTVMLGAAGQGPPLKVTFSQSAERVDAYDFVEVTANAPGSVAGNPFTDVTLRGTFQMAGGTEHKTVDGFCDSADGRVFRIRFMPSKPGDYTYSVTYRQGGPET